MIRAPFQQLAGGSSTPFFALDEKLALPGSPGFRRLAILPRKQSALDSTYSNLEAT